MRPCDVTNSPGSTSGKCRTPTISVLDCHDANDDYDDVFESSHKIGLGKENRLLAPFAKSSPRQWPLHSSPETPSGICVNSPGRRELQGGYSVLS